MLTCMGISGEETDTTPQQTHETNHFEHGLRDKFHIDILNVLHMLFIIKINLDGVFVVGA